MTEEHIDIQDEEVEDRISNATPDLESDLTDDVRQTHPTERDAEVRTSEDEEEKPDTFPRSYVEKLRSENAKYRQRAQQSDELAQRLHTALVAATGRLQDPTDLEFDESHLDDPEALEQAVDDLLARKPHLEARKFTADIGQGATTANGPVDLAGMLRARA